MPIADVLQRADPDVDPSFIAVHPTGPNTVYLATYEDQGFYVSNDGGDTWSSRVAVLRSTSASSASA